MSERLEKITQAVKTRFGADSYHLQSIPVRLEHKGVVNFEGVVETFHIPETKGSVRCYAWEHRKHDADEYVTVVAIKRKDPPHAVMTANEAVVFWMARND